MEKADRIVVVATPEYKRMYDLKLTGMGSAVAAEMDLIRDRVIRSEKYDVLLFPVLLAGNPEESFPPLLRTRIYADFRQENTYFETLFDLILSLYQLPLIHAAVADLRDSIRVGSSNLR